MTTWNLTPISTDEVFVEINFGDELVKTNAKSTFELLDIIRHGGKYWKVQTINTVYDVNRNVIGTLIRTYPL